MDNGQRVGGNTRHKVVRGVVTGKWTSGRSRATSSIAAKRLENMASFFFLFLVHVLISQGGLCLGEDLPTTTLSPLEIFTQQVRQETQRIFHIFDGNDDGVLEKADMPLFLQAYDTDGNGTIDKNEFKTHFIMEEPSLALVVPGLFVEFDANRDGQLDLNDLNDLYHRVDLNEDSAVSRPEFEDYIVEVMTLIAVLYVNGHEFER